MRSGRTLAGVATAAGLLVAGAVVPTAPSPAVLSARPAPAARPAVAPHVSAIRSTGATTVVTADAVGFARPTAVKRRLTSAPGYSFLASSLVGQTPGGFGVWVSPRARHHWVIARYAAGTVRALRALHTAVTYRGYGTPAAGEGVVRIFEGTKGCGGNSSTVGVTWTNWTALPSRATYVTHADVYLCPRLFRLGTWATAATVGHELGHAMGLGHVAYRFLGSYQLMNPSVRPGLTSYRTGDKRGLVRLARGTAAIRTQIPPVGKLDSAQYSAGSIDLRGWALLKYFHTAPVTVLLTDNGRVIASSGTPLLRADVNRSLDPGTRTHGFALAVPWPGGTHDYCVRARAGAHPAAWVQLGCVTFRG